jgi:mRNA-degrading endonuclease toxin of MazEF toxin-antitoxin module
VTYPQGAVVVATDPFGNTPRRPYLVVSNDTLPFSGEEYIALGITTTERSAAIELTDARFRQGELPRTSYVSPWAVVTLKDDAIDSQPALLDDNTVETARSELLTYLTVE